METEENYLDLEPRQFLEKEIELVPLNPLVALLVPLDPLDPLVALLVPLDPLNPLVALVALVALQDPSPRSASRSSSSRSASPASPASRSPRSSSPASRSPRSASNNAGNSERFLRILQGPMAESLFGNLTSQDLSRFAQASTNTSRAVKTVYATSDEIMYKNLIDIYDNPKFKKVIEKIKEIDLKKDNYLQEAEKLKEIQKVYKNEKNPKLTEKEDKIERINDLIDIYFKYFNLHELKKKRKFPSLENYMNYLSKKSSKFDKYSEDINKDIDKDIAILTLFYGFSDTNLSLIFIYTGNKSEILNDYIYLLNELFTKHTGKKKFYTQFELISSVPGVANMFNREGIKEYVKKITDSEKPEPHAEVFKELKENFSFLRKK